MKKACKYCGKIHEIKEICDKKPVKVFNYKKYKKDSREDKFRWTQAWQHKRDFIKARDKYLCQACLNNMQGTKLRLNTERLSVHHIKSLKTDFDLRLDESNLITLCNMHHELAEKGIIPAEELIKIIPPTV